MVVLLGLAPPAVAEEEVRVALLEGQKRVELAGKGLTLFDADDGHQLVRFGPKGHSVLEAEAADLVVKDAAGRVLARGANILAEADGALRVGKGVYFGRVEVDHQAAGKLLVVNRLPLETYLLGIVGSEMNPLWPVEALKAQAVAARTYAMQRRMMMRAAGKRFDLGADVLSQVYKGADRIGPNVIRAVKETRGEVLAFGHDLVEALFHSTCGGHTSSAREVFGRAVPYLVEQRCQWCRQSERHTWTVSLPLKLISDRLVKARLVRNPITKLERKDDAAMVSVVDKKGTQKLGPKQLRAAVGYSALYSEQFSARTRGEQVEITGRGFGHGVGLCQWGAKGMADADKKYSEILGHYYQGAKLKRLY